MPYSEKSKRERAKIDKQLREISGYFNTTFSTEPSLHPEGLVFSSIEVYAEGTIDEKPVMLLNGKFKQTYHHYSNNKNFEGTCHTIIHEGGRQLGVHSDYRDKAAIVYPEQDQFDPYVSLRCTNFREIRVFPRD